MSELDKIELDKKARETWECCKADGVYAIKIALRKERKEVAEICAKIAESPDYLALGDNYSASEIAKLIRNRFKI